MVVVDIFGQVLGAITFALAFLHHQVVVQVTVQNLLAFVLPRSNQQKAPRLRGFIYFCFLKKSFLSRLVIDHKLPHPLIG